MLNKKLKILSVIEFAKNLPTVPGEWKKMSAFSKWCWHYTIGRIMFSPIGLPLFDDDQSIHWYSYSSYAVVGTYFLLALYTAGYYIVHGAALKCLPCTCLLTTIINYIPFVWSALSNNRYKFHTLINFAGLYIHNDDNKPTKYNRICSDCNNQMIKELFKLWIIGLFGALWAVSGPVYVYLAYGTKTTTIEVKFPYIDDANIEYIMNMILQFIVFVHGLLIYTGMNIAMGIFTEIPNIAPKLIELKLDELNEKIDNNEVSEAQIRHIFLDIVKQAQDYDSFTQEVRDFLYIRTLITPALFTYSIGMSIFCQFTMGFVAGYGIALMSWIQFFYICETGQMIQDNGIDEVFYASGWYKLPIELQKDIKHLIARKQNGITLTVGPFGIVNRDLYKVVTNKVYTFVMFLLNFNE